MTTARDLIQRMAKELDLYRQMARDDCTSTHPLADEARAYLAQPEPEELAGTMSALERWAVLSWVEDHIDTNKALRSWRDSTRGGLLMAEVHTVQPGVRARLAARGGVMTELSPAAQAVLNAFRSSHLSIDNLAAALRAAVEQCTYRDAWEDKFLSAERILALATELESLGRL